MREKRIGPRRWRRRGSESEPFNVDVADSARQIGLFETGTGVPHGIVAIVIAFGTAVTLTALRAFWRAWTRVPPRER
jgi:hypothetical protein